MASPAPGQQVASQLSTPPTNLGVKDFGRILVDPATSHVFVSSPGSGAVVVTDLSGNIVKTITGEAGANPMAVNGSTLYVGLTYAGAIEKVDTGTLTDTGPLVTGLALGNVSDMVYAGSKLWTTVFNSGLNLLELISVDPGTNPPTVTAYPSIIENNRGLALDPTFASNPTSNPNLLLAWNQSALPPTLTSLDVSSGSPVQQQSLLEPALGDLLDAAVNPDGAHFVTAALASNEFDEWNLSSLQQDGVVYPGAFSNATSVATSAARGGLMAGGIDGRFYYDFYAYQLGHPSVPLARVDFGGPSEFWDGVPGRGVAISPDGYSAFAISRAIGPQFLLYVVPIGPFGIPGPPTGVTATPGIDSATVSWTPPVDQGSSPITSYTMTSSPAGASATAAVPTTSVVLSSLTAGVTYTFTVTATNAVGASVATFSNAVVPSPRPAGPPRDVTAIAGDGTVLVRWLPPLDPGDDPITQYVITPYEGSVAQPTTLVPGPPPATSAILTGLTNGVTYTFVVAAMTIAGMGAPSSPSNAVTPLQGGAYHPLAPTRILDTRLGVGARIGPLGPGGTLAVRVLGRGGVPSTGVSAVLLNVTVTNTTAAAYLTVYPAGASPPLASNLNWTAGKTVANLVEVAVGFRGAVTIYNAGGKTDVIFDVAGWVGVTSNSLTKDGLYNPVDPTRVLDTRSGTGGVPRAPLGPGHTISIQVTGTAGIPTTGVEAVTLNVTVTGATASSYLTVFPTGTTPPLASSLNFVPGQTVPNRVIVKLGTFNGLPGWVSFFNAAGTVDVIADVSGWFTDPSSTAGGTRLTGLPPVRIFDSREPRAGGPLGAGETAALTLLDQNGYTVTGESAIVINVTVTNPTAPSYLTLWPDGAPRPLASDLNFVGGQTVPNLVIVKLGPNATFDVFNAAGSTDVVIDLVGYYGTPQPAPALPASTGMGVPVGRPRT